MASPFYYLSKKLKQLPGFKTPGDRAFSIIGLILVTIVVLYAIGAYRDHVAISTCKAQGGTPIFRTVIGETIIDANGNSAKLADYQEFDRCEVKP
jgi:hypothetical protein